MAVHVFNSTSLDEQSQKPIAIHLSVPAIKITHRGKFIGTRSFQFKVCSFFNFSTHPVHASILHDIFQARMFAVCAITEVAMDCDHSFRDIHKFLRFKKANNVSETWKSLLVAMAASHAATHCKVVANEF